MKKLTEKGALVAVSAILGIITMLVMFGCSSTSAMVCDSLLGDERQDCLERVKNQDRSRRYQMEINGTVR